MGSDIGATQVIFEVMLALFVRDGRGAILLRYHRNFKIPIFSILDIVIMYPGAWKGGVGDLADTL